MSEILRSLQRKDCERWQAPTVGAPQPQTIPAGDRERSLKQSRAEGYERGFAEGLEAGRDAVATQLATLTAIIDALQTPLAAIDDTVIDAMKDLAIRVARRLIRRELKVNPDEVVAVVREALSVLPLGLRDIRLHLHPADATIVSAALTPATGAAAWDVVEDPVISRGGCRISSNSSRIDATVESRIARVINAALGDERDEDNQAV